jgi:hypothetical protein
MLSCKSKKKLSFQYLFNMCILGEVVDERLIRGKMRNHLEKYGIKTTDWVITFINNAKLRNIDILKS